MTPQELEQLLMDQTLRQPSALLDERVRQELRKTDATPRELFGAPLPGTQLRLRNWLSAGAMLAACVALAFFTASRMGTMPSAPKTGGSVAVTPATPIEVATATPIAEPYSTQEESSELIPGEVVMTSDSGAYRPVRRHTVRTTRYFDPQKKVQMEWTEPSDEIVMMPVEAD